MKKLAVLALSSLAISAHALILPTPFCATAVPFRENFDTTAVGVYTSLPVFGFPAVMNRIGITGGLAVRPYPGVNTVPNMLAGDGADARLTSFVPMRRFGGYFRSGINGLFSSTATFRFYDQFNIPIGSVVVPMTTTFQWVGFQTFPKWRHVEILGAIPGLAGWVAMDSLRIRFN